MKIVKCKCGTEVKTNKDKVKCPICSRPVIVPKPIIEKPVKKPRFFEETESE